MFLFHGLIYFFLSHACLESVRLPVKFKDDNTKCYVVILTRHSKCEPYIKQNHWVDLPLGCGPVGRHIRTTFLPVNINMVVPIKKELIYIHLLLSIGNEAYCYLCTTYVVFISNFPLVYSYCKQMLL